MVLFLPNLIPLLPKKVREAIFVVGGGGVVEGLPRKEQRAHTRLIASKN